MKKVAIIGECMIELSRDGNGSMIQSYGGDTLNTATYLARISNAKNRDIAYISVLGNDRFSDQMLASWQSEGINTDYVLRDPARLPGLYLIELDEQGERTFLNWRSQSAARYLLQHPHYTRIREYLAGCDMVYLSGISLAILPNADRKTFIAQLKEFAEQGKQIVFDSNYRPVLWESVVSAKESYQALLPFVHLALVTQEDEQALWGDCDLSATIDRLQSFGIPNLVVKVGKAGAYYCSSDALHHIPTAQIENVVDTTSAGDAFNAGFIAGYLDNKAIPDCCQQGNELAGIVIQHKGAIVPIEATQYLSQQFQ